MGSGLKAIPEPTHPPINTHTYTHKHTHTHRWGPLRPFRAQKPNRGDVDKIVSSTVSHHDRMR